MEDFSENRDDLIQEILELRREVRNLEELNRNTTKAGTYVTLYRALLSLYEKINLDEKAFVQFALDKAVDITASTIGYFHYFKSDSNEIELCTWSTHTLSHCSAVYDNHYPLKAAGVWADSVRMKKPLIINDYKNLPDKKGLPEGHFPLLRHLGIPIIEKEKPVAILGVGNKLAEYDQNDVKLLSMFGRSLWEIINRKKTDKILLQNQSELERSNQDLEQFAYIASHDLQEPLRKIRSFIDLFLKKYSSDLDDTGQQYLSIILSGAKRMQTMINDLLEYSRLNTKNKRFLETDMNEVITDVIDLLKLTIQTENAEIRFNDLPIIIADKPQMVQLFQNLIANALKFRSKESPVINIGFEEKDDSWLFMVSDNGIGIPEKDHKRVFQLFQRVHNKHKYEGTGIGLSLCKKIIKRHKGEINVQSEEQNGTEIQFSIKKDLNLE